jgi:hypothetical protein
MRRTGFILLMLACFLLPATGGATTLFPAQLDHGDLSPPECLTNSLRGLEVFDHSVANRRFGRMIFVWLNEGHDHDHVTGGDGRIPHFGGDHIDLRRCFDRRSFTPGVPEPMAAVAFGIGAIMVAAALRRR